MLIKLYVRNYALIRELDISPDKGLTVITGETGAGKSILLGALSLVLGSRADSAALLDKSDKCIVEATFRIRDYDMKEFFAMNELDYDHSTVLRREINPAGKSRAFINDTPVNLNVLKELGDRLIDIHSQHQTLMLAGSSFQLNVIDSFANNSALKEQYLDVFSGWKNLVKEYAELSEKADKNKADLEYYRFQLNQLVEAKLKEGEQPELEKEQALLEHTGEIKQALTQSSVLLSGEGAAILNMLRETKANIARVSEYLNDGENLVKRLESVYIELDDIAAEIDRMEASTEADPSRLDDINNRLDLVYSLIQKHRAKDEDELIIKRRELEQTVGSIITSDERLEELSTLIAREEAELKKLASELTGTRKAVIAGVEENIITLLRQLGMPNARFRIDLRSTGEYTRGGVDSADFLFTANKQVEPENLAKVASGGELSRVMLSLKSLLSRNNNLPTIIFDEIDSGVSGEVADKVGQILSEMGKDMQVINITHLPQVAAKGHDHYHVYKDDTKDSTITRIKLLSSEERVREIARLLSGSEVTETALRNAKELIDNALRIDKKRKTEN